MSDERTGMSPGYVQTLTLSGWAAHGLQETPTFRWQAMHLAAIYSATALSGSQCCLQDSVTGERP